MFALEALISEFIVCFIIPVPFHVFYPLESAWKAPSSEAVSLSPSTVLSLTPGGLSLVFDPGTSWTSVADVGGG